MLIQNRIRRIRRIVRFFLILLILFLTYSFFNTSSWTFWGSLYGIVIYILANYIAKRRISFLKDVQREIRWSEQRKKENQLIKW